MILERKAEKMCRNVVGIRNLRIGEGRPKICIPIVGKTRGEILSQAEHLKKYPVDLVEWRADWFVELDEPEALAQVLKELRHSLDTIPLLFTIRTSREGGEWSGDPKAYAGLNLAAAASGCVDLVDVEALADPEAGELILALQRTGVKVIGSNHNFEKTPDQTELVARLCRIQELQADICKLAVMPKGKGDVVALLSATWEMKSKYATRPVITMSMGSMGLVSRLAGETFGSDVTFGAAGQASAPGQIGADKLAECLELLHGPDEKKKEGHIFLIGFMGAGKSTVAAVLKKKLGRECVEMDERIEQEAGQTIASMFEQYGETYFRDKETNLLLSLEKTLPSIVSCGGGVVVRQENSSFMKAHGKIVLLTATPETVYERIKDNKDRPILKGNMNVEYIRGLQDKRRALYESVADVKIATDGKTVEEICEEIMEAIG